jgi:hypothetical protein
MYYYELIAEPPSSAVIGWGHYFGLLVAEFLFQEQLAIYYY